MLKYVDTQVVFSEIPDEITLAINISNCPIYCFNCHSQYLWDDIGTPLHKGELIYLLLKNKGITCIAFMGGDSDPKYINYLASLIREMQSKDPDGIADVNIAWYSGKQDLSTEIELKNFDFIKLGNYIEELGPINKSTTNQRLYSVKDGELEDITYKFWK